MFLRCFLIIWLIVTVINCFVRTEEEHGEFKSRLLETFLKTRAKPDAYKPTNIPNYYIRRENVATQNFHDLSFLNQLKFLESKFETQVVASTKKIPDLVTKRIKARLANLTRTSSRVEALQNFQKCFERKFNDLITCDESPLQIEQQVIRCEAPLTHTSSDMEHYELPDPGEPVSEKNCTNNCSTPRDKNADWIVSSWSKCKSICGPQLQTRKAICITDNGRAVSDRTCDVNRRPSLARECGVTTDCFNRWYASEWSECSDRYGAGLRIRHVFCGTFDGERLVSIEDSERCNPHTILPNNETCSGGEVPQNEWYTAAYGKCSKACGGGFRKRRLYCFKNGVQKVSSCKTEIKPFETEMCNTHSCTEDELMDLRGGNLEDFEVEAGMNEELDQETVIDKLYKRIVEQERNSELSSRSENNFKGLSSEMSKIQLMMDAVETELKGRQGAVWFLNKDEGSGGSPIEDFSNYHLSGTPMERLVISYLKIRKRLQNFSNLWRNVFTFG